DLARVFEQLKHKASEIVECELINVSARPKTPVVVNDRSRWLFGFKKSSPRPLPPLETAAQSDQRIVSTSGQKSHETGERLNAAWFAARDRVAAAVISHRGRLFGDNELLRELAVTLLCNDYGSELVGEAIRPFIEEAVACEGYRFLPQQEKPVVMNVKGAPASG